MAAPLDPQKLRLIRLAMLLGCVVFLAVGLFLGPRLDLQAPVTPLAVAAFVLAALGAAVGQLLAPGDEGEVQGAPLDPRRRQRALFSAAALEGACLGCVALGLAGGGSWPLLAALLPLVLLGLQVGRDLALR